MSSLNILSIDAWRFNGSWTWNAWYSAGKYTLPRDTLDSPRKVLRYMRSEGYLSEYSKGRVYLDDDQYNVVICDRGTHEPLFAIEYGPAYDL